MISTRSSLLGDLKRLGVETGSTVMVHAGLRAVGPVRGGAAVVVQALLDALGPGGTLVAYVDFEPFFEDDDEDEVPVFDKRIARAALDHGVLHETIRTWPGALRSDHPDAGVAAIGARAEWITAEHPFQYGYGPGTPFARMLEARGQVLMLGAPLDTVTLLHHAEHLAGIPDKRVRRYRRRMAGPDGPAWVDFEEYDTAEPVHDALPADCFEQIGQAFVASGQGRQGEVGQATSYLLDGRAIVAFAIAWLERKIGQSQPG